MKSSFRTFLLGSLLLGLGAACDRSDPIGDISELPIEFGAGTVLLETASDTFTIQVEVADTDRQRRRGLMQRQTLAPDAGMIFIFETEQPADGGFWMYNTLIPLSIAFIDAEGRIGSIVDMEPCPSPYPQWCPTYPAGAPYLSALEVNRGYFTQHGIRVGDRVNLLRH